MTQVGNTLEAVSYSGVSLIDARFLMKAPGSRLSVLTGVGRTKSNQVALRYQGNNYLPFSMNHI